MHTTATSNLFSPPVLLYLGIGLMTARITLEGTSLHGLTPLGWLQLVLKATSTTLFWPLVLFVEKLEEWLRGTQSTEAEDSSHLPGETAPDRPKH